MADRDVLDLPEDFERLLRQELSVEPSGAFAAGVRERVRGRQQTSWWTASWIPAIGPCATVASIAWALFLPAVIRVTAPLPPPAPAASPAAVNHPRLDGWAVSIPFTATSRVFARRSSARPVGAGDRADLHVVIVDRRDRVALDRFVNMVQQGRLGEEAFAHTSTSAMVAIEDGLSPIVVAPVAVSGIPVGGVLSSEAERK